MAKTKEEMAAYMKEYCKRRYQEDPEYRKRRNASVKRYTERLKASDPSRYREINRKRKAKRTSEDLRRDNLRLKYGITLEQYAEMFDRQQGLCAVCNNPETSRNRKGQIKPLSVDHNHETNAVRELLCSNCNSLVGMSKENIEVLEAAIEYIKKHLLVEVI